MMKKVTLAAAAALALGLPMTATAAHAQSRGYNPPAQTQRHVQPQRWDARQHNGFYLNGRWNDGRPSAAQMRQRGFQPGYQAPRWNARQHNGYSYNGRWYYGEPTRQIMQSRGYEPGYRNWRRGDRVSASQRAHYRRVDYRRERLREPPRGYEYVRTDRGETLLVAIATGVILSAILSAN